MTALPAPDGVNIARPHVKPPAEVRNQLDRWMWMRQDRDRQATGVQREIELLDGYLGIAGKVTEALECLSQKLFRELLDIVQAKATIALQETLEQPVSLRADAVFKRGGNSVEFWIDREGNQEDAFRGQGGSVANILSVGLRLFALTTLGTAQHRPFLVLDEQDCWLRPDLVPKLAKIVQEAGKALGFQVIMISHHDLSVFEQYADKVYRFVPLMGGVVEVTEVQRPPSEVDEQA